MANDGIRPTSDQSPVRSREPEGAPESKKRKHTDRKSDELDNEPSVKPPQWMSTDWSEQHTAERATEREEPVIHPAADRARRAPNEIGNDHPHLFGKEGSPNQAVRPQDGL